MQTNSTIKSARTMKLLGYAGLIPFGLLLAISVLSDAPFAVKAVDSMLFYAAIILTFLGAVHWGYVLAGMSSDIDESRRLYWAVAPSLIAWLALMLPVKLAIGVLILAFLLCWWIDRVLYGVTALAWYLTMRNHLTIAVVGAMGALLFSLSQ